MAAYLSTHIACDVLRTGTFMRILDCAALACLALACYINHNRSKRNATAKTNALCAMSALLQLVGMKLFARQWHTATQTSMFHGYSRSLGFYTHFLAISAAAAQIITSILSPTRAHTEDIASA